MNKVLSYLPVRLFASFLGLYCALLCVTQRANATPNFLRKIGNPPEGCQACHTISPRLNEFGYRFRAAGYRLPNEIGKVSEKPYELADFFSGGLTANYTASKTETGSASSHTNQLTFSSLDTFPLTGAEGKNFATKVEVDFAPKGAVTLNTAYVRYVRGDGEKFLTARIGIFGKEGYGASDRSIGLSSPLFTGAANFNQTQYFSFQTTSGAEVGFDYKRTSLRAAILNGVALFNDNGTLTAFGAQGGALAKPAGQVTSSTPDFQLIANQILSSNGGGIYLQYYHGSIGLPFVGSTTTFWKNKFDRAVLYGSYPVQKRLLLLGGYEAGRDHLQDGSTFGSGGFFASAEVPLITQGSIPMTAGYRYDFFDPAKIKADNEVTASSAFLTLFTHSGLRMTAELQHRDTLRGAGPDQLLNSFQVRVSYYR